MIESIDMPHILLLVIPGFIGVWSYRYATYSEKKGDFELIGLSLFWGIVIVGCYGWIVPDAAQKLSKNIYAAALGLSIFGGLAAFIAACVLKRKNRLADAYKIAAERVKNEWQRLKK